MILILIASSFLGIFKSLALKRRAEELRGIIYAVEHIKTGISFDRKSVPSLLSELEKERCRLFYAVGKEAVGKTVAEAYEKVKKENVSFLSESDIKTVDLFFSALGRSGADGQTSLCDGTLSRLSKQLSEADEKYKKYGGVFSKSGILAGLFIVILLL